jgi:hypothetical protein
MTRPFDMPACGTPADAAGEICASLTYHSGVRQVPLALSRRDSKQWSAFVGFRRSFQQPLFRRLEIRKCLDFYRPILSH